MEFIIDDRITEDRREFFIHAAIEAFDIRMAMKKEKNKKLYKMACTLSFAEYANPLSPWVAAYWNHKTPDVIKIKIVDE